MPRMGTATVDVIDGVAAKRTTDNLAVVATILVFLNESRGCGGRSQGEHRAAVLMQQAKNLRVGSRFGLVLVAHYREETCSGISDSPS
jgi:hypothetical protein